METKMNIKRFRVLLSAAAFLLCGTLLVSFADGVENGEQNTDGVTDPTEAPVLTGSSKLILTVDQYGNLSSTNAIATSADLAAISASNQLAVAVQEANAEGYRVATNLINEVAMAVATSPIIFSSAQVSSFVAATVFDELTSALRVFQWDVETGVTETKNIIVNGAPTSVDCIRITCGYMFTSDISVLQPVVKYIEHLDGTPSENWAYLNDGLVESATTIAHDPIEIDGHIFTDFYQIHIWVPANRASGFFRVVVQNEAASAEGNTLDTVGITGGYTGTVTNGTMVLNIKGGYVMANGTEQLPVN